MTKPKRPYSLTLVSYFEFFLVLTAINYFYKIGFRGPHILNTIYQILFGVFSLVCGVGFWMMKKWTVYVFAAFAIVSNIYGLLIGSWSFLSLVISVIIFYSGYSNLSKMS